MEKDKTNDSPNKEPYFYWTKELVAEFAHEVALSYKNSEVWSGDLHCEKQMADNFIKRKKFEEINYFEENESVIENTPPFELSIKALELGLSLTLKEPKVSEQVTEVNICSNCLNSSSNQLPCTCDKQVTEGMIEEMAKEYYNKLDEIRINHVKGIGQNVGLPMSTKEINAKIDGYSDGIRKGLTLKEPKGDSVQTERESECVEFTEWCVVNANPNFPNKGQWYYKAELYNTTQLYTLFTQSKVDNK